MDTRREKGLDYNCDEVYTFGHQCKTKHLFMFSDDTCETDYNQFLKSIQWAQPVRVQTL